jgi:hypothetical protein
MGLKLDWRGFLVAAGASVMATSFSELPAVLVQQETGGHRLSRKCHGSRGKW